MTEEVQIDHDLPSDSAERRLLYAALDSFRQYRQAAYYNVTHLRRQSFYSLPAAHIDLLSGPPFELPVLFRKVDEAIDSNADIADAIVRHGVKTYNIQNDDWHGTATSSDVDKARSTIKQLYRDWSKEGQDERNACYVPILAYLHTLATALHLEAPQFHKLNVLVPGAGLGRLWFEIVNAGYGAIANDLSYHQILASAYILNGTESAGQHTLFPWALAFSNHLSRKNQLKSIRVPDVQPKGTLNANTSSEVHWSKRMIYTSGDFCRRYKQPEMQKKFHAVITCYFIDTAPNLISYIETVKHCLHTAGIWINVGPLLWHFESDSTPVNKSDGPSGDGAIDNGRNNGAHDAGSFELSDDEVKQLVEKMGFKIINSKQGVDAGYIQDPRSMLQHLYSPSMWMAKKARTH